MSIDTLVSRGIQQQLIDSWKSTGISMLTECQDRVLAHEPLWEGKNILVVAPTSSGKTFVGEVLAAKSASSLKRAIFLVPYKALAEEKYAEFKERYGTLGISVVISDGDHTTFDRDIRRGDFGIAVIVYEKMPQLLIQSPGILVDCSLIVVDEIQMIADRTRGPSLEILLTHIRQSADQPQIIGLSATMSDLGGLDSWLDADVVNIRSRPVPLWEGIAFPIGASELENVETTESQPGPDLTAIAVPHSTWLPGSKLDITYRILLAEGLSKQTLIFRTRVDDTASTARDLAHVLPAEPVAPEVRSRISGLEVTRTSEFLNQWIDKRVAYHNAGLSLEERRLIEQFFRDGTVRVLVTTSTLAAGVNTPADVVILVDYKRYDFGRKTSVPILVEEYKNSVGRAGRFGIVSEGHSYLVVDSPNETRLVRPNFLLGQPRPLRSSIPEATDMGALALRLLSLGLITREDELRDSIRKSFAFNHYFDGEDDRDHFLAQFMDSLGDLEDNGLTSRDSDGFTVTDLGLVASLRRPVGRPPKKPIIWYDDFWYQAGSWDRPRRVIAKVEWHQGELFPRVGFIVTNMSAGPEGVVHFYNGRGTAEQWIKEGKYALNWTRLSCHRFVANQVRLALFILAYNLGNLLRRLCLPRAVKHWSLRSLQVKLIKIGGRLVRHARRLVFQLAEGAVPREVFRQVLERIGGLHPAPG